MARALLGGIHDIAAGYGPVRSQVMPRAEQERLGDLVDVRRAARVVFQEAWVGYHRASPRCAVYELRRTPAGGLVGQGTLTANQKRARRVRVAIRSISARAFLEALASIALDLSPYAPRRTRTDDYPRLDLFLQVPLLAHGDLGGCVHLHSTSQGEAHAPWAASLEGRTYVVRTDAVHLALDRLCPPLGRLPVP